MYHITEAEAQDAFLDIINKAQKEPVIIERQQQSVAVLMSLDKYKQLTATNLEQLKRFSQRISEQAVSRGLSEPKLQQLLNDEK